MIILPIIVWTAATSDSEKAGIRDNTVRLNVLFLATTLADKLNLL